MRIEMGTSHMSHHMSIPTFHIPATISMGATLYRYPCLTPSPDRNRSHSHALFVLVRFVLGSDDHDWCFNKRRESIRAVGDRQDRRALKLITFKNVFSLSPFCLLPTQQLQLYLGALCPQPCPSLPTRFFLLVLYNRPLYQNNTSTSFLDFYTDIKIIHTF